MILGDDDPVVVKRYEPTGSPVVECSGRNRKHFVLCIGGNDYYAQEERLDREQAQSLRDALDAWLGES